MQDNGNVVSGGGILNLYRQAPDWRSVLRGCLIFLAVTLPLAFYLRTYDSATVKVLLLHLGIIAAVAAWLWGSVTEGRFELPLRLAPVVLPAALLLLWNAGRFAFSGFRMAGATGFALQAAFLLTFILAALAFSRRELRRAVMMTLGAWVVAMVYGFLQLAGLDPFVWKGAFGDRVFSMLANPALFAAYGSVCAQLALALACDEERPLWLRAVAAVLALAWAWLTSWTGDLISKVIFIGLIAVFAAAAWRALRSRARAAALALCAASMAAALVPLGQSLPAAYTDSRPKLLVETWKGAAAQIAARPWLGSGPGSFWAVHPAFRRPAVILLDGGHNYQTEHPGNEALKQWAEGGLPAVIFWLWLFAAALYKGWKSLTAEGLEEGRIYVAGLFAATAGSVLFVLSSNAANFAAPGWMLFFVAGLLAAGASGADGRQDNVAALPLPIGAARKALAAVLLAGLLFPAYGAVKLFQSDLIHNLAIYYSKAGDWDRALAAYSREVPWAPTYIAGKYFSGNIYADRAEEGDLGRALACYQEVRDLAPDFVAVAYREAKVLDKLGETSQAIERMERQVQIDPVWEETWTFLADLYKKSGDGRKEEWARAKAMDARAVWPARNQPQCGI